MKNGFLMIPSGFAKNNLPQRIVSLVPSQTELLADLDLEKRVVGITKFCVHPESWFHDKVRIGGTKKLNIEKIKLLQPDLIIANKEENEETQIKQLARCFPVYVSDIASVSDALNMIKDIGELTGKRQSALDLVKKIQESFDQLKLKNFKRLKTAYLIWKSPWMSVGKDTFIHQVMNLGGFQNIFEMENRYPVFQLTDLQAKQPELILLSSEPYPFRKKHIETFQRNFPNSRIILVDGEMFSWYGSRMLKVAAYLKQLRVEMI